MNQYKDLLRKSGVAVSNLASKLVNIGVGDKLPTYSELFDAFECKISRGTLQNAMKTLKDVGAITVEARGALGTFVKSKNLALLLSLSGVESICGVMPLPYTRIYEGIATGVISCVSKKCGQNVDMCFLRGSEKRINAVLNGRYDFAIISRLAAKDAIRQGKNIEVAADFGDFSYVSGHVVAFGNGVTKIEDGIKIGVDKDSFDHMRLTFDQVGDCKVEIVDINYSKAISYLLTGKIDATIWNLDEIQDRYPNIVYSKIKEENNEDNVAVMVVRKDNIQIKSVISSFVDVEEILTIQKQVVDGILIPSY